MNTLEPILFGQPRPLWRCTVPHLKKIKQSITALTLNTDCQARWWRGEDFGSFDAAVIEYQSTPKSNMRPSV